MKARNILATFLFALIAILANALPPGGNSWAPSWTTNLGITFNNPPAAGADFSLVTGVVSNPEVLSQLGMEGVAKNSAVVVTPFHQANFRVTEEGKTFYPSIIKVTVGSRYVVVSPQRGSGVKKLATGDKDMKPGGNSWAPSWTTNLGIAFSNPPANGASYNVLGGSIEDPGVLKGFGFPNLSVGQKLKFANDAPLEIKGTPKAIVRISTSNFYEVFVVENGGKLVLITKYW
jgi:hypothetical protein